MNQDEKILNLPTNEIKGSLTQIKYYLEDEIAGLKREKMAKDTAIKKIQEDLEHAKYVSEGSKQLINKLLGEISKLQNDIEWYQKTYEQRSFLGTIREKIFRSGGSK